ncbi:MAG: DUF4230 domain-containing protein [Chloroflexota bacterium]
MRKTLFTIGLLLIIAVSAFAVVRGIGGASNQFTDFLSATPTITLDPVTIIHEVQSLARLETIHYSLEKVITAETNQDTLGFLFGDKLLFVAHGKVIAGIDLEKLTEEDLEYTEGVLYVNLPQAEIFIATLDNDKSYVYDRDTGLLAQNEINLETAARQSAEQAILEAALEDGILEQAQINAENYMVRLLRNLGFPEVVFSTP